MPRSSITLLGALLIVVAAAAATGWYHSARLSSQFRVEELTPVVALLHENAELLQTLRTSLKLETDHGILPAYLAAIRADGIPKHAEIKQRLDRLAENNSAILALLQAYGADAKSVEFRAQAAVFQRYAIAWRDRWNSVMELFMAGGNYPAAEVPFPQEFLSTVQAETAAVQRVF